MAVRRRYPVDPDVHDTRILDDFDVSVWQRQQGESTKAYAAFCVYRDMGPERSCPAVAAAVGKSGALMRRWSSRWEWVRRAAAYDDYEAEIHRLRKADALDRARNKIAGLALQHLNKLEEAIGNPENPIPAATVASQLKQTTEVLTSVLGGAEKLEVSGPGGAPISGPVPQIVFAKPDGTEVTLDELAHPSKYANGASAAPASEETEEPSE